MKAPSCNHVIPSKYKFFGKFSSVHSMLITHDIRNLFIFYVDLHEIGSLFLILYFALSFLFLFVFNPCIRVLL